jgi:predicted negative regulator of RcsB-dependent stress response
VDRLTRKELKSDRFALEVQHSVEYVSEHRKQVVRWGGIAVAVALVVLAVFLYRSHQHTVRQAALRSAMVIQQAQVGPAPNEYTVAFPTADERVKAVIKAMSDVATRYSGTDEGYIAEFYLGTTAADTGNTGEAQRRFKLVVDNSGEPYASLARLSLAQLYGSQGKLADAEALIRYDLDHPTILVSKEEATIALARLWESTKPQEARKLLEPLRASPRSAVSRAALTALSEIPQK